LYSGQVSELKESHSELLLSEFDGLLLQELLLERLERLADWVLNDDMDETDVAELELELELGLLLDDLLDKELRLDEEDKLITLTVAGREKSLIFEPSEKP
jgi:hypothetical protein